MKITSLFKRCIGKLLCWRLPKNCFRCRGCWDVRSRLAEHCAVNAKGVIIGGLCPECHSDRKKWKPDCLFLIPLMCLFFSASCFGYSVELGWEPSPDANVTSYHIYVGAAPGQRERMIDAGNHTVGQVDGLVNMQVVYFVVRAFDAATGLESDDSNEIGIPVWPVIAIQPAYPPYPVTVFSQVETNRVFVVEYCDDLARGEWFELDRQTGAGAPIFIGDRSSVGIDKRFYRGKLIP